MTKPIQSCKVCHKKTADECSHVACPNRKPVTAQLPEGNEGYGTTVPRWPTGSFRKTPTSKD